MCLYKNKIDGKLYAIKEIVIQDLDPRDRKAAQNEMSFTKVLKGPTIIQFYESIYTENSIFIVMEYASKGNLDQAIMKKQLSNTKFSNQQILRILAHIVLAVMVMHKKDILHRDIKA